MEVISVPLASEWLERVWELYRKNSGTLGFLPRGALEEFAGAGHVLGVVASNSLLGYVAWRHSRGDAVVVHLCVSEEYRRSECAGILLNALIDQCKDCAAIRLSCRMDYHSANNLWPKHGFTVERETTGRGADAEPLFLWRRRGVLDAPLLREMRAGSIRRNSIVAIDANVFFDMLNTESVNHEESSSLLATWLDLVEVCVTPELRNEISRRKDLADREAALKFSRKFDDVECGADLLSDSISEINDVLPEPKSPSDYSDRRQIAHAWRGGASIFASRDGTLLDHSDELFSLTGVAVLRPGDALSRLQGDTLGRGYAPVKLQGTSVEMRPPRSEKDLLPFQNFSKHETKSQWLSLVRGARSNSSVEITMVGEAGVSPRIAIAVDNSDADTTKVRFLRSLSGDLTGTLLRRVLSNLIETSLKSGKSRVEVTHDGGGEVERAFSDLSFRMEFGGKYVRQMIRGVAQMDSMQQVIEARFPGDPQTKRQSGEELERELWPLKVLGCEIPIFIVPIREAWAAALFDSELAGRGLFPVPLRPALALENVYYSASNITIPAGSRMVWYVSREVGEVRAISTCLGTDSDAATRLARRYHRLGAYMWRDVLEAAGGNAEKEIRAYRFARTEILSRPMSWEQLSNLLVIYTGKSHKIQSPLRIPEELFEAIYRHTLGTPE